MHGPINIKLKIQKESLILLSNRKFYPTTHYEGPVG